MSDNSSSFSIGGLHPVTIISLVAAAIFVIELLIMLVLDLVGIAANPPLALLVDAAVLTMVMAPLSRVMIQRNLVAGAAGGGEGGARLDREQVKRLLATSQLVITLATIFFVVESLVMLLLQRLWGKVGGPAAGLIDAGILAVLTAPVVYHLVFRAPLRWQRNNFTRPLPLFLMALVVALFVHGNLILAIHHVESSSYLEDVERDLWLLGMVMLPVVALGVWGFANAIARRNRAEQELERYAARLEEQVRERTRQLVHADRLATMGTFAANMAHEVNNPNAFIAANTHFLKLYWEKAGPILERHAADDSSGRVGMFLPEIPETLEGILTGSRRIGKIIDSLKSYAKQSAGERVVCRVSDPVSDAVALLRHRFERVAPPRIAISPELLLNCDRQQLGQVFVNLFNNALDAIEEAGLGPEGCIEVQAEAVDGQVRITVRDNGPGIPEAIADKVFDPFFTSKGKTRGTGLGLSIVQGIIEEHGGTIRIEKAVVGGAVFVIVLAAG